jgi:DNA-directed RNA polymerase subunit RPC12/RpoP
VRNNVIKSKTYQCQNCGSKFVDEKKMKCLNCDHNVFYVIGKERPLIVIEDEKTGERYLHNPFESNIIVPEGYIKITSVVPLIEEKYGHLPLLNHESISGETKNGPSE